MCDESFGLLFERPCTRIPRYTCEISQKKICERCARLYHGRRLSVSALFELLKQERAEGKVLANSPWLQDPMFYALLDGDPKGDFRVRHSLRWPLPEPKRVRRR